MGYVHPGKICSCIQDPQRDMLRCKVTQLGDLRSDFLFCSCALSLMPNETAKQVPTGQPWL